MATFQARIEAELGPRGYENCMRRSVQSVVLYEAHRCVSPQLTSLRPFQRKLAFFDQANALLESLTFMHAHQKSEVMWRTATSKEIMQPDVAWKRRTLIERELSKLREKIKDHMDKSKNHNVACDAMAQVMYESFTKSENVQVDNHVKTPPLNWEHAHNNVLLTFRMYFRGADLDPSFPPARPPKEIVVPAEKPRLGSGQAYFITVPGKIDRSADLKLEPPAKYPIDVAGKGEAEPDAGEASINLAPVVGVVGRDEVKDPDEDRRKALAEVREHLELLKEFEGVISDDDIKKRKRDLFLALPAAPPAQKIKGAKHDGILAK